MREFTAFEKELLQRIESGAGRNLYSLIDPWIEGISFRVNRKTKKLVILFETTSPEQLTLVVRFRLLKIQGIIVQAVNLIKLFSDKGFFFVIQTNGGLDDEFTFGQAAFNEPSLPFEFADSRVSELFCEYATMEIMVTPELKKFIDDGFIAREEVRANRQYKLTRRAFYISATALALNFLALLWNITNTKDPDLGSKPHNAVTHSCHGNTRH